MFISGKCVANTEVSVSCIFCMFEIFHHCLPLPNSCKLGLMLSCLITPSPLGGPHYLPPPQWL